MHLWLSVCLSSGSWEWGEQNGEGNGETAWWSRESERVECRAGWGWGEEGKIWNKTVVSPTFASHGLLLCPSGGPLWIRNVTSPCSGGCTARFSVIDDNISLLQIAFNNTDIFLTGTSKVKLAIVCDHLEGRYRVQFSYCFLSPCSQVFLSVRVLCW